MTDEVPDAVPARDVGPGGTIRFAVGSPTGLRSASWRIWSSKNTTDVYVAGRSIVGTEKISLHQSGNWSHSFVSDEKARPFVAQGTSRHLDLWQRPDDFAKGWTHALSIIVPWTELRPWPEVEQGDVVFVPHPGSGYWAYIEVFFVRPVEDNVRVIFNEMFAVGNMRLVDGSEAKVVAHRLRPNERSRHTVAFFREQALAATVGMVSTERIQKVKGALRLALHGVQENGSRSWVDLALVQPPPGQAVICTWNGVRIPTG